MTTPTAYLVDANSSVVPHVNIAVDPTTGAGTLQTVDGSGNPVSTPIAGGGGSGTVKKVNGVSPDGSGAVTLAAGNVQAIPQAIFGIDCSNNPTNPVLVNGTPGTVGGVQVFAYKVTAAGATFTVDGNTYTPNLNDTFECVYNTGGTALAWKLIPFPQPAAVAGIDANGNSKPSTAGTDYAPGFFYSNSTTGFVPPSGNVTSTAGAVTIPTGATVSSYTDGAWGFFPANALFSGQLATDAYWCVSTDTQHFTVYTAKWTPGTTSPAIPTGTLVPLTTVVGSYTQSTSAIVIDKGPAIPAGTLGPQGEIGGDFTARHTGNANGKTFAVTINGANILQIANSTGTDAGCAWFYKNRGRSDRNYGSRRESLNQGLFPLRSSTATDTTPLVAALTVTLAVATDAVEFVNFAFRASRTPQA